MENVASNAAAFGTGLTMKLFATDRRPSNSIQFSAFGSFNFSALTAMNAQPNPNISPAAWAGCPARPISPEKTMAWPIASPWDCVPSIVLSKAFQFCCLQEKMKKHFYSLTKAECFGSSTFQKIQKSIETPPVSGKNPRRTKKRTCKSLEQAENHEKAYAGRGQDTILKIPIYLAALLNGLTQNSKYSSLCSEGAALFGRPLAHHSTAVYKLVEII